MARAQRRRWVRDEDGVSDVVGSILLVSITVLVAAALVVVVLSQLVPNKAIHADLQLSIKSGDGIWTNGNEQVVVEHRGGEDLKQEETSIRVLHEGTLHTFEGAALGFSDGRLELGETWTHVFNIAEGSKVGVDVIGKPDSGGSLILATNLLKVPMAAAPTTAPPPPGDPFRYASSFTAVRGTMANFGGLQSATAAEATLTEAAAASTTISLSAQSPAASGAGWTNTGGGVSSGNGEATTAANTPAILQYRHADVVGDPGTITNVVLQVRAAITGASDDAFTLSACISTTCTASSPNQGTSATIVTMSWDVTNLKPGGGAWTWAEINALEDRITPIKVGGRDGTWRVDWAYVDVTYSPAQFGMEMQLAFSGVQPAATHELQLKYRVIDDTFRVQVLDVATGLWNTRGNALTATSSTTWTVALNADEFNGGSPRIRIMDATPLGSTAGRVFVDYARVTQ